MAMLNNREQIGVTIGWLITALGSALIIVPPWIGANMMRGGYALQFIGILVVATGLLIIWLWRARANVMARLLAGDNLLAQWTYAPAQAQRYAAATFAEAREQNRGVFFITATLFVVIGIPVLVIPLWHDLVEWPDPFAWIIVGGYFALIPVLGLFAWGMPLLAYRRALQDGAQVWIARDGLFVNGALYTWQRPLSFLRRVRFNHAANPPALQFDIANLTRLGVLHYATTTVRVPVPPDQAAQAENVTRFFEQSQKT